MQHQTQLPSDVEHFFRHFPHDSYWKLLIDVPFWSKNNPMLFDKQESPGYLHNSSAGLLYALLSGPLTVQQLVALHYISYNDKKSISKLGLKSIVNIGFAEGDITEKGLIELIEKIKKEKLSYTFIYITKKNEQKTILIDWEKPSEELAKQIFQSLSELYKKRDIDFVGLRRISNVTDVIAYMQSVLKTYEQEIQNAASDEFKIKSAIVKLVQDLHQHHPFVDGNGRLFIFIILNKLLMENSLRPSIIEQNRKFNGHAVSELVSELNLGQDLFKKLLIDEENQTSFLSFLQQTLNLSKEEQKEFELLLDPRAFYQSEQNIIYVNSNADKFPFEYLSLIYDKDAIDLIFKHTPPPQTALQNMFITSAIFNNSYMMNKILEHLEKPENLKNMDTLETVFKYMDNQGLINLSENKKFKLTNAEWTKLFLLKNSRDENGQDNYLFRNLLYFKKGEFFKHALQKLDKTDLEKILGQNMRGITGLQLLAAYDDDLFNTVVEKLEKTTVLKILKIPPTTKEMSSHDVMLLQSGILRTAIRKIETEIEKESYRHLESSGFYQRKLGSKQEETDKSSSHDLKK